MGAQAISFDYSKYNFRDEVQPVYSTKPGLSEEVVDEISRLKDEPEWMRRRRLEAYRIFLQKPMPTWGADLSSLDFQKMRYYVRPTEGKYRSWEEVPEYIKRTFERLGIPEAERKFLAGVGAQYDSEVVYHNVRRELEKLGVIFCDMDTAVREYPEIVRRYFGTVVPADDNKFAALNTAVWSGGSFVYVPEGVEVEFPLQAYFRINAANMGQFERTLIIAEPYSKVHYIEGCNRVLAQQEVERGQAGRRILLRPDKEGEEGQVRR
jgi:Fe-S cluster assembly protein SufB